MRNISEQLYFNESELNNLKDNPFFTPIIKTILCEQLLHCMKENAELGDKINYLLELSDDGKRDVPNA